MKNLFQLLTIAILIVWVGASQAASSKTSKIILVNENIGQPPAYNLSFKAYTSSLAYTNSSGLSLNLAAAQEQNIGATGIAQIPVIPSVDSNGAPLTQSALLTIANAAFAQYAGPLSSQLASYMSNSGAGSAIFNYQEQVMVQGNSMPMVLTWQIIVDVNGRPRYGNAQLIPTAPNFVYADYTSQAVASTLPSSFAYPQAGSLQWQQVNQQMQPVTAMQTINVNGIFDAPVAAPTAITYPAGCLVDSSTGLVGCDPDYGLKCLINHVSDPYSITTPNPANPNDVGCPVVPIYGFTDIITLENANGASGGFVDYVRTLTPVYTYSTDSNGNTVQTAAVTVSVNTRNWSGGGYNNCPFASFLSQSTTTMDLTLSVTCTDSAGNNIVFQALDSGDASLWAGEIFTNGYEVTPVTTGTGSAVVTLLTAYFYGTTWDGTANVSISGGTSGSGGLYTNTGSIGYEVQSTVDRYYVTPDGTYSLIGAVTTNTIAPNQSYSKTVALPSGANAANYGYIIIDPFNTPQLYDYRNDTVNYLPASNYLYVAPIVIN